MSSADDSGSATTASGLASRSARVLSGQGVRPSPGSSLGIRYDVIASLGVGGMGEVYHAFDRELHRDVALKIIRPELANDPILIDRFRREIRLSSSVTHKNVLRVYDLGEADGQRFLSMQYVEGEDLAARLRHGSLDLPEALRIFRQICHGLMAAHEQGVIHRDLKPHNILIDRAGTVFVTDFGLAKMSAHASLTDAGKVVGSPQYMSPEQVRGNAVDQRSDIYSLGLVFYRMLTGELPFEGETPLEIMVQRLSRPARPVREALPDLPPYLAQIIDRCLAAEADHRYQSVAEIITDLDAAQFTSSFGYAVSRRKWLGRAALGVAVVLVLAGGGWWAYRAGRTGRRPAAGTSAAAPVRVLVADLQNRTGDPLFEGTLEPVLTLSLEGAPFISAFSRESARKTGLELRPGAKSLDETVSRLIAVREGLAAVIAGSIEKAGNEFRVVVRALEPASGKVLGQASASASSREKVLPAMAEVAGQLRQALGDTSPAASRQNQSETFTTASLRSAHDYARAQELQLGGRYDEAAALYASAIERDPKLGRAYAGLAVVSANLGQRQKAEEYYKLAMANIDRMTDREKYRTRGGYYLLTHNIVKAIDEYGALVRAYPADMAGQNNLGVAYFLSRDMGRALQQAQRLVKLYPTNALYRANAALFAMYGGEFDEATRQAQAVLALNPSYVKGYLVLAMGELARGKPDEAGRIYERLAAVSPRGASVAARGKADLALYEGRGRDAVALLETGVSADRDRKDDDAAANKLALLAYARMTTGDRQGAISAADQAIADAAESKDPNILFTAARAYIGAGVHDRALAVAATLGRELSAEPQMFAKLIEGEVELSRSRSRIALDRFMEAQRLADSWMGRFDLGRAYLALNALTEAGSEFDVCLRRRGEATGIFLDDLPTFHLFAPLYYYIGRVQQGMNVDGAGQSYQTFLNIRGKSESDPLVTDARARMGRR